MEYDICILQLKEITPQQKTDLPYGIFAFKNSQNGPGIKEITFSESDEYIDIGRELKLYESFTKFRELGSVFDKLKYKQRQRTATLLYGPPGNGKTIEVSRLGKIAKEEKFRIFFINDSDVPLNSLNDFRPALENEWTIFVIEELTEFTSGGRVDELLSFLDGETSWNKSFTIATTNHPEEIPCNIIDRPSRFKHIIEVKNPNEKERTAYLKAMGVSDDTLAVAVEATKNLSLDYVKNIAFDAIVSGRSIPEIVVEYKKIKELVSKQFKNSKLGM